MPSSATSRFAFPSVASPSLTSKNILKSRHKHSYYSKVTQEVQIPTVQTVLGRRGHTIWTSGVDTGGCPAAEEAGFCVAGKMHSFRDWHPTREASCSHHEKPGRMWTDWKAPSAAQCGPAGKSLPCLNGLTLLLSP